MLSATNRTLVLPTIALLVSIALGAVIVLHQSAILAVIGLTGVVVIAILIYHILAEIGTIRAMTAMAVLLLSGFLGTYTDLYGVTALNEWIRWVAPLTLALVAACNLVFVPGLASMMGKKLQSYTLPLGLFLFYSCLSTLYSVYPLMTLGRALSFMMITVGVIYALLPQIKSYQSVSSLLWVIALLMGLAVLPGEFLVLFPGGVGWIGGRFRSSFWNPVTLGHMSVVFFPLFAWVGSDKRIHLGYRIGAVIVCGCLLLNIILSQSRGAILGILVAALVLSWQLPTKARFTSLVLTAIAGVVMLSLGWSPEQLVDFFTRNRALDDPAVASGRVSAWTVAYQSWQSAPIWGFGFGTGGDPSISFDLLGSTGAIRVSNVFLETMSTGGLVGLTLLMATIIMMLLRLLNTFYHPHLEVRRLGLMALATFCGGLTLNLFETWLVSAGSPFAFYWWLVLFLAIRQLDLASVNRVN